MELQDALKSCDWNVTTTMEKLSSDMKAISEKQKFVPKEKKPKHRVEAHAHFEMSDDESEEEEFRDNKFVYDSDSDAEEEEINEDALPEDKKRVLNFFNTGNPQVSLQISVKPIYKCQFGKTVFTEKSSKKKRGIHCLSRNFFRQINLEQSYLEKELLRQNFCDTVMCSI